MRQLFKRKMSGIGNFIISLFLLFIGCDCEKLFETNFYQQQVFPEDLYLKETKDSANIYRATSDTIIQGSACFKCFAPGTSWTFYHYISQYVSPDNGYAISAETIMVVLDSIDSTHYYCSYSYVPNVGGWKNQFTLSTNDSVVEDYAPFYFPLKINPLPFQLDNKNWGYCDYPAYYTSDLGTIYRNDGNGSYILLMKFNDRSIDVGRLLNEMFYKGRKLGEL